MAEAFSNSLTRAAGIMTSYSGSTIGAASTSITVTAATGIGVSHLVVNANFIAGTKVRQIAGTTIYTDRASTNTASATSQIVEFLGVTTAYTSPSGTKAILVGGTFANGGFTLAAGESITLHGLGGGSDRLGDFQADSSSGDVYMEITFQDA